MGVDPLAATRGWGALGDAAPGLISAYRVDAVRCVDVRGEAPQHMFAGHADDIGWWLHFDLVDRRSAATLAQLLAGVRVDLAAPIVDAFLHGTAGPELHFTQGVVHGALLDRVIDIDGVKAEHALLNLVCVRRLLITGRRLHLHGVYQLHRLARDGRLSGTPSALLNQLGRFAAGDHAQALERAGRLLDQYEDQVLSEARALPRGEVMRLRYRMVQLHRELASLLRLYERADEEIRLESSRAPAGGAPYGADWLDFGSLVQHLQNMDGTCLALHDRARLLQDEVSDQLTVQTNRQLYVLSILTAVLVPPTIVVGVFGMNTGGLPLTERPSGFLVAMLLCVASSLVVTGVMVLAGVIALPPRLQRRLAGLRGARRSRPAEPEGAVGDASGRLAHPAAGRRGPG
jgi:zinc transporter